MLLDKNKTKTLIDPGKGIKTEIWCDKRTGKRAEDKD